jgi:asparagine synthase (glutamine-hydrolysing)
MCGIAGFATVHQQFAERTDLNGMTEALRHRGPDGEGVVRFNASVFGGLGHTRLAVIDLSPGGRQPMQYQSSATWIVFNGEIYNYRTLRLELEALGYRFSTATDTEVILNGYVAWGTDVVERLRGMFAFAIWDQKADRSCELFLARDHLGVKPLYFAVRNGSLVFASEVRALLASGVVERKLSTEGMLSYLSYGSVQEPFSVVDNVRSLGPGQSLRWKDGAAREKTYWIFPDERVGTKGDLDEVRVRLVDAVQSQLVSDVPLGAFLSGGIDSSSIAAIANPLLPEPLETFTVALDVASHDEGAYAQRTAEYIGTQHHELMLRSAAIESDVEAAVSAFDQPSIDGLNTYFVARAAKQAGLTVALSGVGGDELFIGYDGFRRVRNFERVGTLGRALAHLYRWPARLQSWPVGEVIRRVAMSADLSEPYFASRQLFTPFVQKMLLPDVSDFSSWRPTAYDRVIEEVAGFDTVNKLSALEMRTYMRSTLLRDTDQMSMAHALEVRVPFLDHLLVTTVLGLAGKRKLRNNTPKALLVDAVGGALPPEAVTRTKQGFDLPFDRWMRTSLRDMIGDTLLSPGARTVFDRKALGELWQSFEDGRVRWSRVWALFTLSRWLSSHGIS